MTVFPVETNDYGSVGRHNVRSLSWTLLSLEHFLGPHRYRSISRQLERKTYLLCTSLLFWRPDMAPLAGMLAKAVSPMEVVTVSSPISMLVPPAPIRTSFFRSKPCIFPIPSLASLFHQPVTICAAFVFIPFMPVTAFAIIITMRLIGISHYRHQERTAQYESRYKSFHNRYPQ